MQRVRFAPLRLTLGGLLLAMPETADRNKGRLVTCADHPCRAHIAFLTQGALHPECLMWNLETAAEDLEYTTATQEGFTQVVRLIGSAPFSFSIGVRWQEYHSPYPEIKSAQCWAFGTYIGAFDLPKEPDDFITILHAHVAADGTVTANGKECGIFLEFLPYGLIPSPTEENQGAY